MISLITRALADLNRNRLHAAVTLIGLTLALAAAIIIGLFVRQQYSYERFIPGHSQVFRMTGTVSQPGQSPRMAASSPPAIGENLRGKSADIEAVARLSFNFPPMRAEGQHEKQRELKFAWADPDYFKVMPLRAIAGNPATALEAPGSVVITRAAARRYFGRDTPLGAYLELFNGGNRDKALRLRVTAVIEDMPDETHLDRQILVSGRTPGSPLAASAPPGGGLTYTYVRTRPGVTAAQLQPLADAAVKPFQAMAAASGTKISLYAVPIHDIHFGPADPDFPSAKPTIAPATVQAIAAVGLLILLMAATNYVALMTARAGARGVEVAVRKAAGAGRGDLIRQFLGECLVHVLIAMLLAMALVELALPAVNAMLGQTLRFELLRDPLLLPVLMGIALIVALLAGLYPAFILSSFRPSVALRGGSDGTGGAARVRQVMVALQFGILVGLSVAALTIYRQTNLALGSSIAAGRGPVLLIVMNCRDGIAQAARELPGVKAATCADGGAFNFAPQGAVTMINKGGRRYTPGYVNVDPWYFPAFGIRPVAGRLFSPDALADKAQRRIVINETAARNFGFASPHAAVGQTIQISLAVGPNPPIQPREIIGVVADRPSTILEPAGELIYTASNDSSVLAINSTPENLPLVRAGMEKLWKQKIGDEPFSTNSLDQFEHDRYLAIITQGRVIAACAIMAVVIAAMGLFALAAFMAQQRMREIGLRKAMGAATGDVMTLLLWQFTKPVLIACVIALPLVYLIMGRWLDQFAARVDLPLWLGAGAAAITLAVALLTVGFHVFAVARARPATSLRYE